MKAYFFPLLLLLTWFSTALHANPRRDFATQYRPERRIQVDTRREGDSVRVYLRFPNRNLLRRGFPLHIVAWADYEARRPLWQDTVRQLSQRLQAEGQAAHINFCLPMSRLRAGQVLSMAVGPAEDALNGDAAWVQLRPEYLTRPFIFTDSLNRPLMRRYLHVREVFGISAYGPDQRLRVYRYPLSSAAAAPPMAAVSTQGTQARTLSVQDSAQFRADELLKLPAGLFLLRVGSSPVRSGLLVEDNQFPALTTADELIAPLIYLTTSQERQKLFDASDPKKAVDQFWLTVAANSQPIARQLIRTYYGRVTEAGQLFSGHKAGWLTDRGLLYLVLGPPESVYREAGVERWVYRADPERSGTFIFRAKPSTFAPDNYELVRRPEYEQLWYAAVEQWRKGRTARPGR